MKKTTKKEQIISQKQLKWYKICEELNIKFVPYENLKK